MSIFNDKALKGVAEAAAKIMAETSHGTHPKTPKEKSLAALAHPKDKITHKDVLVGRGVLKKEEIEQLDEVGDTPAGRKALHKYVDKAISTAMYKPNEIEKRKKGLRKATSRLYKDDYYGKKTNEEVELNEEAEQLQEYESKDGKYTHKGTYGREKGAQYGESDYSKGGEEEKETEKAMKSPKRAQKGYGAHQNKGVRGKSEGTKKEKDEDLADTGKRMKPGRIIKTKTGLIHKMNESLSFTEMLELYNEHGLKVLAPIETEEMDIDGTTVEVIDADKVNGVVATAIEEEATEEEFNKELKDQQDSFAGKKKQPKVAAGKTTGVKVMPEEVEQIDEISADLAGKYLTAPQGKGANKYKVEPGKSKYPNAETMFKHTASVKRALQRSDTSSLNKKPSYYKEEVELEEEIHSPGTKVRVPHKGKMVSGKVVRHDKGSGGYSPAYVVDVGEYESKIVPSHKVQKEEVELDERTLTPAETAKKEQIVKSMKKGLSGFKQRYGERAKEVMYATATKQAKKD